MRPSTIALPLLGLALAAAPRAAHADVAEEPAASQYDCSVDESCPGSGKLCEKDACFKADQCPTSGVECDWRDDTTYETCTRDAEGAGLTLRCDSQMTVYCDASEAAPAGSAAECHAKQRAAGLEARCEDEQFSVVYCDPAESSPSATTDDEGSGCAIEAPKQRRSGLGVALAAFVVAASATWLRARRRARS